MRKIEIRYELFKREYKAWEKGYIERHKEYEYDENDAYIEWEETAVGEVAFAVSEKYELDWHCGDDINGVDTYGESWLYETNSTASIEEMQKTLDEAMKNTKELDGVCFLDFSVIEQLDEE